MENINTVISISSLLIAILAISLNNRYASAREYRKEFRARLESILDKIDDLEVLAVKFHTSEEFSDDLADEIRWRVERLSRYIQTIPVFKSNPDISKTFNDFKRSAMAANFGKSRFSKKSSSSKEIRDIHGASSALTSSLLKTYDSVHPLKYKKLRDRKNRSRPE